MVARCLLLSVPRRTAFTIAPDLSCRVEVPTSSLDSIRASSKVASAFPAADLTSAGMGTPGFLCRVPFALPTTLRFVGFLVAGLRMATLTSLLPGPYGADLWSNVRSTWQERYSDGPGLTRVF